MRPVILTPRCHDRGGRPVAVVTLALACAVAVRRMPVDIFPGARAHPRSTSRSPTAAWTPSADGRILTYYYEYHFLYITGIEHVESKSIQGAALMKLLFHPGTDMTQAMARRSGT